MALTYSAVEGTNLITVAFNGGLEAADVAALRTAVEAVITEQGSVKLLLEYGSTERIQPKAIMDDLKSFQFVRNIDRAAIVTDASWISGLASTMGHFVPFDVKVFKVDDHGKALEWVTT